MSRKIQWDPINKKYVELSAVSQPQQLQQPRSVVDPDFNKKDLLRSIDIDHDSERSGDEGDYKYQDDELDELVDDYLGPNPLLKKKRVVEDTEDEMPLKPLKLRRTQKVIGTHYMNEEVVQKLQILKAKLTGVMMIVADIEKSL